MTVISTAHLRAAFSVNDLEIRPDGSDFLSLLNELGIHDVDGLRELLIERIERNDLRTDLPDSLAIYLDGIAAGIRALRLSAISTNQ